MPVRLLYPCTPFNLRQVDETYQDEFELAQNLGIETLLISFEDLLAGHLKTSAGLQRGDTLIYRGWMLNGDQYRTLHHQATQKGCQLQTTPEQYLRTHHLPGWYSLLQPHTPETRFFKSAQEAQEGLQGTHWPAYFVKDWVKSLSTPPGPVAHTLEDIPQVVQAMVQYRGGLEGGLCIRQFEPLLPETEERYFVVHGQPHASKGPAPDVVHIAAHLVASPFFSVDVATREDGTRRIVELGDGQVSDLKGWSLQRFQVVLKSLTQLA